jgi:hypothetical protein
MEQAAAHNQVERLAAFVGVWSIAAVFPGTGPSDVRGRTEFTWMSGERFLVQRVDVPHPDAPDSISLIGYDPGRGTYLQHYFDSRGVARVYAMSFAGGVWTLHRTEPDFSPLDFAQRFTGTFDADGRTIRGRWETSADGATWEFDFDLIYTRIA